MRSGPTGDGPTGQSQPAAVDGVPTELLAFQLSLSAGDQSPAELLGRYDAYTNDAAPAVGRVDHAVPIREVAGWRVTADVYRPVDAGPFPVLVYLHGGAWVMGAPSTHRRLAAELAALGLLTVVVDYRRAPRHRFPAAVEDTIDAVDWARRHAEEFGGDPATILVGGDSAGANLTAAALVTGDVGPVRAALLCYGIFDFHRALPAFAALVGGAHPDRQRYLPPAEFDRLRDDPRLSPERACDALPETLVLAGDRDPLYEESVSLAKRLGERGRPHSFVAIENAPHGFLQLPGHPSHDRGLRAVERYLRHIDVVAPPP